MKENGPINLVKDGYKQLGDVFSLKVFSQIVTCMVGPEAQGVFFGLRDDEGEQRSVYKFTVPVFGPNIAYDAEPKRMAEQLRFLKYGLAGEPMRRHGEKIVAETQDFFAGWVKDRSKPEPKVVDLHQTMSELIINTASRSLMGKEIRENLNNKFADLYQTLSDGMTHLTVAFPNAPVPLHIARDKARKEIVTLFKSVIDKKRAKAAATGEELDPDEDMINFLLSKKYSNKQVVTDDDICGLLLATLFAGQHTSTITATWCGLEIIKNKALIPRLLAEQKEVLADTDGELTFEALQNMTLLYACVQETLRKYPPLIALLRKLKKPIKYKDYTIPAGNIVAVLPAVAHKLEEVFPEPDKFDPERFLLDWDMEDLKKSWCPFGGGIHKCLGQKFGLLQVTAVWSVLLRNFDLELVDDIPKVDYSHLVAGPLPTTRVKFTPKRHPMTFGSEIDNSPAAVIPEKSVKTEQAQDAEEDENKQVRPTMTLAEVVKHNTEQDCYVAIHGKVYNMTSFLPKHPGGVERVMAYAGQDATFAFENQDHSKKARLWMKSYAVADLAA
eukprot:CAMPEP_0175139824 /NCGR_PEP_ID=MMETSP0087-20121206/11129_1 /TAXON_ID=136419 /ORGANISM="Unknown Unknown, Strain D1" /LENGTH=554 /DNA_ID=CAMNT_0016422901 /DNA_START=284 /DNA_END=1948 /DNA_ORIENTATION=-